MGTSSVAEDAEFVEYGRTDDEDDDGMDEDDQAAARALPVPHIAAPAAARARGRFLGRSASVLASSRDRFDSVPSAGNNSPHGGPQRCEKPPLPDRNYFFGVISRFGIFAVCNVVGEFVCYFGVGFVSEEWRGRC